jgi:hypothetical protein
MVVTIYGLKCFLKYLMLILNEISIIYWLLGIHAQGVVALGCG